jgi:hypothetical protein
MKLGKLRRVDPRSVWQREAHDFELWLRDHVDLLSEQAWDIDWISDFRRVFESRAQDL